MGAYWNDGKYTRWDYWVRGDNAANRENNLKLQLQEIRRNANTFHYKGVGHRLVKVEVDRRKDEIHIRCYLEDTKQKKFKPRKGRK